MSLFRGESIVPMYNSSTVIVTPTTGTGGPTPAQRDQEMTFRPLSKILEEGKSNPPMFRQT